MFRPFYLLLEGADRAIEVLQDKFRNRSRRFRWVARTAGLAVVAMAVTQLIPTLADESTPPANEEVIAAEVPMSETVVVLGSSGGLTSSGGDNSIVSGGENGELTYASTESESTTVEVRPNVQLLEDQGIVIRLPSVLKVDPRSVTTLLPALYMESEATAILCLSGEGLRFDLANKGFEDDIVQDDLVVEGDLTSSLRVSGSTEQISSLVNSIGGLRIWSTNRVVAGRDLRVSVAALSGVSVDSELCSATTRMVQIKALGVGLETKKGGGTLN